jgi:hypothetical protein
MLKQVPIHEAMRLEIRGELFNAFNKVNFQSPSGNGTCTGCLSLGHYQRL